MSVSNGRSLSPKPHISLFSDGNALDAFRDDDNLPKKQATIIPLSYTTQVEGSDKQFKDCRSQSNPLITSIPSSWEDVKNYVIDWQTFDSIRLNEGTSQMQKWIGQKVAELLGEAEPSMTQFIYDKVCEHTPPDALYKDLLAVLDEDTEAFVRKLYRMVVYEIKKA